MRINRLETPVSHTAKWAQPIPSFPLGRLCSLESGDKLGPLTSQNPGGGGRSEGSQALSWVVRRAAGLFSHEGFAFT